MYLPERSHPIGPVGGITDICCSQSRDTVRSLPGGRLSSEDFNDEQFRTSDAVNSGDEGVLSVHAAVYAS